MFVFILYQNDASVAVIFLNVHHFGSHQSRMQGIHAATTGGISKDWVSSHVHHRQPVRNSHIATTVSAPSSPAFNASAAPVPPALKSDVEGRGRQLSSLDFATSVCSFSCNGHAGFGIEALLATFVFYIYKYRPCTFCSSGILTAVRWSRVPRVPRSPSVALSPVYICFTIGYMSLMGTEAPRWRTHSFPRPVTYTMIMDLF